MEDKKLDETLRTCRDNMNKFKVDPKTIRSAYFKPCSRKDLCDHYNKKCKNPIKQDNCFESNTEPDISFRQIHKKIGDKIAEIVEDQIINS